MESRDRNSNFAFVVDSAQRNRTSICIHRSFARLKLSFPIFERLSNLLCDLLRARIALFASLRNKERADKPRCKKYLCLFTTTLVFALHSLQDTPSRLSHRPRPLLSSIFTKTVPQFFPFRLTKPNTLRNLSINRSAIQWLIICRATHSADESLGKQLCHLANQGTQEKEIDKNCAQ